jgi:hypothetical protein
MQVKTDTDPSPLGKQLLTFASALERSKNCLAFQNCSIWIQSQQRTCVGQWIQLLHTTFLLSAKHVSVTSSTYLFITPTVQTAYDILSVSCKQNHGFSEPNALLRLASSCSLNNPTKISKQDPNTYFSVVAI